MPGTSHEAWFFAIKCLRLSAIESTPKAVPCHLPGGSNDGQFGWPRSRVCQAWLVQRQ